MDQIAKAYALVGGGNISEAVALLESAGREGNADALVELALWYLQGRPVLRDLAQTRAYFGAAAKLGHSQARMIHLSLLANGTGGPRDWKRALELLDAAAADGDPDALAQLDLIGRMSIDDAGDPLSVPSAQSLSDQPDVKLFPALLTAAECSYLVSQADPLFQPAIVINSVTGETMPNPVRTSENAGFPWISETPAIHALNRRMAAASGTRAEWGEPLQILRYRPGQQYKPHYDGIAGEPNQRILTMLVYLNDGFTGGETAFVRTGLKVVGKPGDALLFRNADDRGNPDPIAEHAGLPVTSGEKLIASRWIRQARFGPV